MAIKVKYEGVYYTCDNVITDYQIGTEVVMNFNRTDNVLFTKPIEIKYIGDDNLEHIFPTIPLPEDPIKCTAKIPSVASPAIKDGTTIIVVISTERIDIIKDFTNFKIFKQYYTIPDFMYPSTGAYTFDIVCDFNDPILDPLPYFEYTDVSGAVKKIDFSKLGTTTTGLPVYRVTTENTNIKPFSTVTIKAVGEARPLPFILDIENCTITPQPPKYFTMGSPSVRYELYAKEGYEFTQYPYIEYYDYDGVKKTENFNMKSDGSAGYLDFPGTYAQYEKFTKSVTIHGFCLPKGFQDYNISTVYNPSDKELLDINNLRYYPSPTEREPIDLAKYIVNLKKVYLNIPERFRSNVKLGYYEVNVSCNTLLNPILEYSLGTHKIKGNYNNSLDFSDSIIELHLPYSGIYRVDPYKYINKDIEIIYKVNLYTCSALIEIRSIENDITKVVQTFIGTVSMDVPYLSGDKYTPRTYGEYSVNEMALSTIKPKIVITNHKLVEKDVTVYGITTTEFNSIGERKGYFSMVSPKIEDDINLSEKLLLEDSLRNGIIIK